MFQTEDMVRDAALGAAGSALGYGAQKLIGAAAKSLGGKADEIVEGAGCAINSFTGDTLVSTIDGLVPIAFVTTGTVVLAWDETTNTTGYFPVTQLWAHAHEEIVVVEVGGERIETTAKHPFYVANKGWVDAASLQMGDLVPSARQEPGLVGRVWIETRLGMVHNLTVDGAHTLYVGIEQWLVHNCGGGKGPNEIAKRGEEIVQKKFGEGKIKVRQTASETDPSRIYDGSLPRSQIPTEIKSSTRGVTALDSRIRSEVIRDGLAPKKPLWIFVQNRPSRGLAKLLKDNKIHWIRVDP